MSLSGWGHKVKFLHVKAVFDLEKGYHSFILFWLKIESATFPKDQLCQAFSEMLNSSSGLTGPLRS